MKTSETGVALIKRFEGLELQAYQDIAGIWTIGYGHTGPDVKPGQKISEREAEDLLRRDLKPREEAVARLVTVSLNQNEFDALVSFVYNVGIEAFRKSTARRRLNGSDRVGAAEALTWFNKATVGGVLRAVTGLTRRRAAERALFLEPIEPPTNADNEAIGENSRITPVEDAPRRPNLAESRSIQGAAVAGGAGVAASTLGRDSASELHDLEKNVEEGRGLTIDPNAPAEPATDPGGQPAQPDAGAPAQPGSETPSQPDSGTPAQPSPPDAGSPPVQPEGAAPPTTTETVALPTTRPSAHEKHEAEAQIQFALLVMIVLSVAYIVFARMDDWWRYRR
jgi:lysozyme